MDAISQNKATAGFGSLSRKLLIFYGAPRCKSRTYVCDIYHTSDAVQLLRYRPSLDPIQRIKNHATEPTTRSPRATAIGEVGPFLVCSIGSGTHVPLPGAIDYRLSRT